MLTPIYFDGNLNNSFMCFLVFSSIRKKISQIKTTFGQWKILLKIYLILEIIFHELFWKTTLSSTMLNERS